MSARLSELAAFLQRQVPVAHAKQETLIFLPPNLCLSELYTGCPNQIYLLSVSLPGLFSVVRLLSKGPEWHLWAPFPPSPFQRLAEYEKTQLAVLESKAREFVFHRLPPFRSDLGAFAAFCGSLSRVSWWRDAPQLQVHLFGAGKERHLVPEETQFSSPLFVELFQAAFGKRVQIQSEALTLWILRGRQHKAPEEIESLKESVSLSVRAHQQAARFLAEQKAQPKPTEGSSSKCGCTDVDVETALRKVLFEAKQDAAFPPIVLPGSRGSELHGVVNGASLCKAESVIIDFGARYNAYHADITRTYVWGTAAQETYRELLAWYEALIGCVRPGLSFQDLNRKAQALAEAKWPKFWPMGHSVGHHIGLCTHDPEIEPLQKGDAIALELGYYPKETESTFAFRIEDNFVLSAEGVICLSAALDRSGTLLS